MQPSRSGFPRDMKGKDNIGVRERHSRRMSPERQKYGEEVLQPGKVYILVNNEPKLVRVMTGITDGTNTEIHGELKAGDKVIIGTKSKDGKPNGNGSQNRAPGFGGRGF